jgi:hypothetical protein
MSRPHYGYRCKESHFSTLIKHHTIKLQVVKAAQRTEISSHTDALVPLLPEKESPVTFNKRLGGCHSVSGNGKEARKLFCHPGFEHTISWSSSPKPSHYTD